MRVNSPLHRSVCSPNGSSRALASWKRRAKPNDNLLISQCRVAHPARRMRCVFARARRPRGCRTRGVSAPAAKVTKKVSAGRALRSRRAAGRLSLEARRCAGALLHVARRSPCTVSSFLRSISRRNLTESARPLLRPFPRPSAGAFLVSLVGGLGSLSLRKWRWRSLAGICRAPACTPLLDPTRRLRPPGRLHEGVRAHEGPRACETKAHRRSGRMQAHSGSRGIAGNRAF